jgi:hypothetical protein
VCADFIDSSEIKGTSQRGRDNMKTKLLGTIGALVLFGLGAQASATTIDLGSISAGDSAGGSVFYSSPGVSIDDTVTFSLTDTLLTAIVIDSGDLVPFFNIDGLTADADSDLITFEYDAHDNRYFFSGNLPAGDYSISVGGTVSGSLGGQYEVSVGGLAPAPVPVPGALWLFSGALLLLRRAAKTDA